MGRGTIFLCLCILGLSSFSFCVCFRVFMICVHGCVGVGQWAILDRGPHFSLCLRQCVFSVCHCIHQTAGLDVSVDAIIYTSRLVHEHWNDRCLSRLAFGRFCESEFKTSHLCGKHFAPGTLSPVHCSFSYSFSTARCVEALLHMTMLTDVSALKRRRSNGISIHPNGASCSESFIKVEMTEFSALRQPKLPKKDATYIQCFHFCLSF